MNKLIFPESSLHKRNKIKRHFPSEQYTVSCLRRRGGEAVLSVSKIQVTKVRKSHRAIFIVWFFVEMLKVENFPRVNNTVLVTHGCFTGVKPTRLLLAPT